MSNNIHIKNLAEMQTLAAMLAELIEPSDVITLQGDLGMGKTEFARAMIRSLLGDDQDVPSPTFNLVHTYDTPIGSIWHFDLYRLQHIDDVWELGLEEALQKGICLIEWPERLQGMHFHHHLNIEFKADSKSNKKRLLTLNPDFTWKQKIESFETE